MQANLLCTIYKHKKSSFSCYRGFRLASVKLVVEYLFSGYILKVEQNNKELRYDIYLRTQRVNTKEEINFTEIQKFRHFYGRGFNVILLSETDENLIKEI